MLGYITNHSTFIKEHTTKRRRLNVGVHHKPQHYHKGTHNQEKAAKCWGTSQTTAPSWRAAARRGHDGNHDEARSGRRRSGRVTRPAGSDLQPPCALWPKRGCPWGSCASSTPPRTRRPHISEEATERERKQINAGQRFVGTSWFTHFPPKFEKYILPTFWGWV